MDKLKFFISIFKHTYLCSISNRDIFYKFSLIEGKFLIYMKNLEYYDISGQDDHQWNFKFLTMSNTNNLINICDDLRTKNLQFFDYKIKGKLWK